MTVSSTKAQKLVDQLQKYQSIVELAAQVAGDGNQTLPEIDPVPVGKPYSREGQLERLEYLKQQTNAVMDKVLGDKPFDQHESLKGNIENFIGMAQIPIGLAGPLRVNGTAARGDYFVPLATTEGALVASYNRGIKAIRESGGVTSVCMIEGVQRSPFFKFKSLSEVGVFVGWILQQREKFDEIVGESSRFAKLEDLKTNVEGNGLILTFEYHTGDAAGQNMVTICTSNICKYILKNSPIKPTSWFIESNYSGDKKATALSFSNVRGKKVTAEVVLKKEVVEGTLKTTPVGMAEYWQSSTLAVIQSGSIGAQGHVANGLTALFIACGQDVACIAESAVGITRMQVTEEGDLYVALTLPSLIVGTVGGGTNLPTQRECLALLDCTGTGTARKFAEICTALALAGEVSIAAAMSAHHFSDAHQRLGRK